MEHKRTHGRSLDKVSHFFLSGRGPLDQASEPTGKEVRADVGKIGPLPGDVALKEGLEEAVFAAPVKGNLCLLLSSNSLIAVQSCLACNLALELARRNFSVGLIETTTRLPYTFFLFGGYENVNAIFWEKGLDSADFLAILHRLSSKSDFLIINVSSDIIGSRETLPLVNPFFIVSTTVHSEELLNSYLLVKQISRGMPGGKIGLLVMEERHSQKGEAAFSVMAAMADKFLSCKVRFMGTIYKETDLSWSTFPQPPSLPETEDSPVSQSIRKLADSLTSKKHIDLKRRQQW
ncbi:MAG: hypothetical protein HWN69_01645 [Desulfobacterales bacterium]|nr:hypothetical protein [Desulfobacterales bacterium]